MKKITLLVCILIIILVSTPSFARESSWRQNLPQPLTDSDYLPDAVSQTANLVKIGLGRSLFFDKILSGNKNISCASCHHPLLGTTDGLSLPVGEGAHGLGATRNTGEGINAVDERVPRNSPALFNLGAKELRNVFHDGRVAIDSSYESGFLSPAFEELPVGFENVAAVQAIFPITSNTEMAGQHGENSIADAASVGNLLGEDGVWSLVVDRLRQIEGYVELFIEAYPEITSAADISIVHVGNAIAAFEINTWRSDSSRFDRFLRGNRAVMTRQEVRGMKLFYGKAGCHSCHKGVLLTDQEFHVLAIPQIGPGKGHGINGLEDFGRENVTGDINDRYKFRTPSLRNVALTGPWGHDGAYDSLKTIVKHHFDPYSSMENYDKTQVVLPTRQDLNELDFSAYNNLEIRRSVIDHCEIVPIRVSDQYVDDIVSFLYALTDESMINLRKDVPKSVLSGLSVTE